MKDIDLNLTVNEMGATAINSFAIHDSHQRLAMLLLQLSQAVIGSNMEEMRITNGTANRVSETGYSITLDGDVEIVDVIQKYSNRLDQGIDPNYGPKYLVVYYPDKNKIDYIEIPRYEMMHTTFGFEHKLTEEAKSIRPGDFLSKDTSITTTNSRRDNNGLAMGVNVLAAIITDAGDAEDAAKINRDSLHKFKFSKFRTSTMTSTESDILLNLYGKGDRYQVFPNLGEKVREDGVLYGKRAYKEGFAISNCDNEKLKQFDPFIDDVVYVEPNSVVVGIDIIFNSKSKIKVYHDVYDQLAVYIKQEQTFYNKIISSYERIKREYPQASLTPKYNHWVVNAKAMADRTIQKINRRETMDTFTINITTIKETLPAVSQKLTGVDGDKIVCSAIVPPEEMPRDKDGRVADIEIEFNSTFSRMNEGRLYRGYIGMACLKLEDILKDEILRLTGKQSIEGLDSLNKNDMTKVYNIVLEFLKLTENTQWEIYNDLVGNYQGMYYILKDIIGNMFQILLEPLPEKPHWKTVIDIHKSRFSPTKDKLTVYTPDGHTETKDPIMLQELYIMLLNKTGSQWMASPTPYINPRSAPAKPSNKVKVKLPFTNTPVGAVGATEVRLYAAFAKDVRAIIELMDRAKNPETMKYIFRQLLTAENPMKIDRIVDRDKIPYGNSPTNKLMDSVLKVRGIELDYIPEELTGDM